MSWKKETDAQGRTVWTGQDSIVNKHSDVAWLFPLIWVCFLLFGGAFLFCLVKMNSPHTTDQGLGMIGAVLTGPMAGLGLWAWIAYRKEGGASSKKWFAAPWGLTGAGGALAYVNGGDDRIPGSRWNISVEHVASVEAAQTANFIPARTVGAIHLETSPNEWQTFLVMSDQSRRVILTANADRESCVTLAASIRAYVEAQRMATKPADAAAPVSTSAAPLGEGFDL